jgi:hypothetical protein
MAAFFGQMESNRVFDVPNSSVLANLITAALASDGRQVAGDMWIAYRESHRYRSGRLKVLTKS